MDHHELLDRIGMDKPGKASFFSLHSHHTRPEFIRAYESCLRAYSLSDEAFGAQARVFAAAQGAAEAEMLLYLYIRMSRDTLLKYRKMGISDKIFCDTMHNITTACRLCRKNTGIYGISPTVYRNWLRLHLDCRIFRLGRLQFELAQSLWGADIGHVHVKPGDTCLKVHIPADGKLTEPACEDAFTQARFFFKNYFNMEPCVFFCRSWLMDPWLQQVLPADSGIVKFQKLFRILDSSNDPDAVIKWVFPLRLDDPECYPQDTTLRRAVRERLLKALPMGLGLGVKL